MEKKSSNTKSSPSTGCTIVVTGKLKNFTRNAINDKISSIGATARSICYEEDKLPYMWGKARQQTRKSKGAWYTGSHREGIS